MSHDDSFKHKEHLTQMWNCQRDTFVFPRSSVHTDFVFPRTVETLRKTITAAFTSFLENVCFLPTL